jgi:hypothetical protein
VGGARSFGRASLSLCTQRRGEAGHDNGSVAEGGTVTRYSHHLEVDDGADRRGPWR